MKFIDQLRDITGVVIALAAACQAGAAIAQDTFPNRPVTLVVPYAPGGGTDAVGRTVAKALQTEWGRSVIVENRSGAEGWVGTQYVLSKPADGYTILLQLNSMLLWKWALPEAKIDFDRDLTLISKLQSSPIVTLVRGDAPAKFLPEMMEYCKKKETPCSWGTSTVSAELVARQFIALSGRPDGIIVPYKGTAPMVSELLGGHIDIALVSASLAVPFHNDGRGKAIGVGSNTRFPRLPDIPTFEESGYKIASDTTWYGLMVRHDTPEKIVKQISDSVQRAGKNPEVRAAIESQSGILIFNTPQEFKQEFDADRKAIAPVAQKYLATK